jgi:hypothetical protein
LDVLSCAVRELSKRNFELVNYSITIKVKKAVPLHAMEALGGRGDIAPTHSRPRH